MDRVSSFLNISSKLLCSVDSSLQKLECYHLDNCFELSSNDISRSVTLFCNSHSSATHRIISSFILPLIESLCGASRQNWFSCADWIIAAMSSASKDSKDKLACWVLAGASRRQPKTKSKRDSTLRLFHLMLLDRIPPPTIPDRDVLVLLLSLFDDDSYSVRYECAKMVAMYGLNHPAISVGPVRHEANIDKDSCTIFIQGEDREGRPRTDETVIFPKMAWARLVKCVYDYCTATNSKYVY